MQKSVDPLDMERDAKPLARPQTRWFRGLAQAGLMIAVLAGGVAAMNRVIASAPERTARPFTPPVITVQAVPAEAGQHTPRVSAFGEIVAARSVELRPAVAGEIIAVSERLRVGDQVEAGAIIATIDAFEYEGALVEARANLQQTEAAIREIDARIAAERDQMASAEEQLQLARDDLARAEGLGGAVTARQIDERRLIVSQRDSALAQRRNNLAIETARLEQQRATAERLAWKTAQAERALENTRVKAPFTGIVQTASAEIGKRVGAQDVLATLYAPDALELRFTVTDAQFGRLLSDDQPIIGRPVDVAWDVGATRYTFAGTVTRIGAQLANTTGGAQLIAAIDDASLSADGRAALRPGAFVEIALPEKTYAEAVRLPETALYDQSTLYAVEDGVLVPVTAQVLAYDGAHVLIAPEGIVGRTILTTRLASIDPGMKVAIEGAEPAPRDNQGIKPAGASASARQP